MRCWFLSGSQGLIQELCLVWAEAVLPGEIRCKVLKEVLSHCGTETPQGFILNKNIWDKWSSNVFYRRVQLSASFFIFFSFSLKYLSDPEATFGKDWANAVDFIAATHFCTDLPTTNIFQSFLPQRMLVEEDVLPSISDFSPQQDKVLVSLRVLHKANKLTGMPDLTMSVVHRYLISCSLYRPFSIPIQWICDIK